MSCKRELKKIFELEVGVLWGDIIVRVERIISVQHCCHPLGPYRPMIEQQGVHIVVFDDSVSSFFFCCLSLTHPFSVVDLNPILFCFLLENESVACL